MNTLRLDRVTRMSGADRRESIRILSQAKKFDIETPSVELNYKVRLASKRLHRDRLASKSLVSETSLALDKESED